MANSGRRPEASERVKQRFAAFLRQWLDAAGFSANELGRRVGVKSPSVSFWASGKQIPTDENLYGIIDVLEIPPGLLWQVIGRAVPVEAEQLTKPKRYAVQYVINGTDEDAQEIITWYRRRQRGEQPAEVGAESQRDELCRLLDEAPPERVSMALAALRAMLATEMRSRIENGQ